MYFQNIHNSQQSSLGETLPLTAGGWILEPHSALTLQSAEPGVMRVVRGRVWATVDGPHSGPANDLGDRVLQQGEALQVRADQRLVIEPWARSANEPVYFSWEPLETVCVAGR
jgi:hypothetical protein